MVGRGVADAASVQGFSGRGEGGFGYPRLGQASQPGASATGAGVAVDLDVWQNRGVETDGNPKAMRSGLDLCSNSMATMGGGGAAAGERSSSGGRAADLMVRAAPTSVLAMRLRGGADEEPKEEDNAIQKAQGDEATTLGQSEDAAGIAGAGNGGPEMGKAQCNSQLSCKVGWGESRVDVYRVWRAGSPIAS